MSAAGGPELPRRGPLAASVVAAAAAILVVTVYALHASALVRYPWDWSPDEGLTLDYARRVLAAPATLYPHRAVPFPVAYGPLLPVLLAPLTSLAAPLGAARLAMLVSALLGAAAAGEIVRRRAGLPWALATAALCLAPFDISFWHVLVRVDGPMVTFWLWAAVFLLPAELSRGSDHLSGGRLAAGTSLLLAAALVKPVAVLHGAPLVLGWALVDLRSARRLALAALAGGVALVVALQVATSGGFLWVQGLWTLHPSVPGQGPALLAQFWGLAWPVLAVAMLAVLAAAGAQARVLREPAWLLLAGGGAVAPLLGKHGAGWNYLLPLFAAAVVAAACFLARAAQARRGGALSRAAPILALSVLAVSLAATSTFPLPTALDEATGRAFYGFTEELRRRAGGPVLATRPDFVYFLAGQPVEAEGSSFIHLAHAGAPGAEEVLQRLVSRRYSLVVWTWPLPSTPEWTAALHRGYERVGECRLGWYFGSPFPSYLAVRRDVGLAFAPPPGTRCTAVAPQG